MAILIGVDEAGYGPNYGPLVVAATAWRVEEAERGQGSGVRGQKKRTRQAAARIALTRAVASPPPASVVDLYKLLAKAVVRSPAKCSRRLAIADSKALYKAGGGLLQLERGVLAALAMLKRRAVSFRELLDATQGDPRERRRELACHADDEGTVPVELTADDLQNVVDLLDGVCQRNGVELIGLRVRLVYPAEFNDLVDEFGTKGAALSHVTLALVRQLVDALPAAHSPPPTAHCPLPTSIFLDKHGGRSRYAALLQHHFSECWIDAIVESRGESRYHWEYAGRSIEAAFRVGCEELLPTALASMAAKYHRELAMRAFNAYWTSRVPGLRPTAGYPRDAGRFKADISVAQRELGIEDRLLWRSR
jgi:ribonuclease HII